MPLNQSFFASIRRTIYLHGIPQSAVDACNTLYEVAVGRGITSSAQFAYILSTVHGEAGPGMLPVEEYGRGKNKRYGYPGVTLSSTLHIPAGCLDKIYYGRGWPQLTWYDNYLRLEKEINMPLTSKPELMLNRDVSAAVTIIGMKKGLFTGHKLDDYFAVGVADWANARHIINGTDKAQEFADIARKFYTALLESGVSLFAAVHVADPAPAKPVITPAKTTAQIDAPRRGLFWDIMAWFGKKHG